MRSTPYTAQAPLDQTADLATKLPLAGGTMTGPTTNFRAKGPAAVTTFAGTISRSGTTLTFSSAADAILAGYDATNPILGTTVIHPTGPVTMVITAWLSNVTCTVDSSGTLAAQTPTSTQFPIMFVVTNAGVLKAALLASGFWYIIGSVGVGTASTAFSFQVGSGTTTGCIGVGGSSGVSMTGYVAIKTSSLSGTTTINMNSSGGSYIDTGYNFGVGTSSPQNRLEILDNTVLGATELSEGDFTTYTKWGVSGGWDASFTGGKAVFAIAGGAGNLTQTAVNMANGYSLVANRWYKLTYTVSSVSGSPAATITTAVASTATALTLTNGAQATYFYSGTAPGTFTINATAGNFSLDTLVLTEIQGGAVYVGAEVKLGPRVIPVGTTGNQTINKASGRVNIAAAGTTVTVTNSLVTANSTVIAVAATNDATGYVKNVVPAAGSFVVNLVAAATAETAINWMVLN